MTWQRMLSNIHQIPSRRIDATYYTHTTLDEGITKKIQPLNDKCMNDCTVGTPQAEFSAFLAAGTCRLFF